MRLEIAAAVDVVGERLETAVVGCFEELAVGKVVETAAAGNLVELAAEQVVGTAVGELLQQENNLCLSVVVGWDNPQ
jgi:hypothetical protein